MLTLQKILEFLQTTTRSGEAPRMYGTFHIICIVLTFVVAIALCILWERGTIQNVRNVLLATAIIVLVFEIYKQIVLNFTVTESGIAFNYNWNFFPWQVCSTPLYVGFVAGLTKGKSHNYLCSYLATYALFAGMAVMLFPGEGIAGVFSPMIGINVQTMICHCSMVVIAIFLYYTEHVDTDWFTLLKAFPIFAISMSIAVVFNEAYHLLFPDGQTFNMFFISRHYPSTLPVYSSIHNAMLEKATGLYPLCLVLYALGFAVLAALVLLLARVIKRIIIADYDEEYAEIDARRQERLAKRQEKLRLLEEKRREEKEEERARRKEKQEAKREEREQKRDEKRTLRQKEQARRRRERKQARKDKRKAKRKEKRDARRERRREKQKERREERRLERRMKEIEKREKQQEKAQNEAEKQERKRQREEEKALKKWLKEQKKLGNDDPDIEEFYDWYYG